MKIKKFSVDGFRSLKEVTWAPGDLNVLIGPNGSGKSNLLRAVELLQEAGTGDLDKAIVRQGGLQSILWGNKPLGQLRWDIDLELGPTIWPPLPQQAIRPKRLAYELILGPLGRLGYRIEREMLRGYAQEEVQGFKYFERDAKEVILFDSEGRRRSTSPAQIEETRTILAQTSQMFSGPETFLLYRYVKGLGIYQDSSVDQDSAVRKSAVTRRELQLSRNGDNLVSVLHSLYTTDKEFKFQLNDAMIAAFGKEFEELEFPPAEDQRIQMRVRWKTFKVPHPAADLSDGTLRFLMLIAVLANRSRGDLVAIDEPETGLNPSMFPIVAELAAEASRSSQIVFTTHSPEFLTAVGAHGPQTTVMQSVDGGTKLAMLTGEDLRQWLEKYKLGELFLSGELEALT